MSMRMTHFFGIDTPIGMYDSFDKALKEAEALKIKLDRICKNKGYSCLAYIGVSQNDKNNGTVKVGYRGKREFVSYDGQEVIYKEPHIHIIIFANPAETLRKCICEYIDKRHKGMECWAIRCDDYFENKLTYIMKQSLSYRTVACNVDMLPTNELNAFCGCAENLNRLTNGVAPVFKGVSDEFFHNTEYSIANNDIDLFTLYPINETEESIDIANDSNIETDSNKLQCNNIANSIAYNIANNIANNIAYRDKIFNINFSKCIKNFKTNCISIWESLISNISIFLSTPYTDTINTS